MNCLNTKYFIFLTLVGWFLSKSPWHASMMSKIEILVGGTGVNYRCRQQGWNLTLRKKKKIWEGDVAD